MKISESIRDRVRKENIVRKNAHIVLGLSGGPDSMCLFDILLGLREEKDLTLSAVHVNHNIRPIAADQDQHFVEKVCRDNGIPLKVVSVDCVAMAEEMGMTTEEAGREARYKAFREAGRRMEEGGVSPRSIAIAVAHNADDQVETVLQRIIRGTGTDGLSGMEEIRKDISGYHIIRPLLGVWKKEILEYCRERSLEPRMDHTNEEPGYMRNKIRLELIPVLETYNPELKNAILRLAEAASQDGETLKYMAEMAFSSGEMTAGKNEEGIVRLSAEMRGLQPAVVRRVIKKALDRIGLTEDVTYAHYKAIEGLLYSDIPSARTDLPGGYVVRREYDKLVFAAPEKSEAELPELKTTVMELEDGMPVGEDRDLPVTKGRHALFDEDALAKAYGADFSQLIEIRYRRPGDYIPISGGKKKIQDLFVDMKVPRYERDKVPMCCIGNEVLFIPVKDGVIHAARYSKKYPVEKDTKKAFLIEVIG